jgi:hypothetical protein
MFGLKGRQLFILLVLIAALFAGSQYVPGYIAAYQFNDYVRQEVKYAVPSRKTPEAIRQDLLEKATELGIPLDKQDVSITRRGPAFNVEIEYHWPIDMKVYHQELVFHVNESGEVFENASY